MIFFIRIIYKVFYFILTNMEIRKGLSEKNVSDKSYGGLLGFWEISIK